MLLTTSRVERECTTPLLIPPASQTLPFSPPPFANPEFDASFAGGFTAFAKFDGNPNIHPVPEVVTPNWSLYTEGNTEMLFNRTGNNPDIHPITTDPALLQRCE